MLFSHVTRDHSAAFRITDKNANPSPPQTCRTPRQCPCTRWPWSWWAGADCPTGLASRPRCPCCTKSVKQNRKKKQVAAERLQTTVYRSDGGGGGGGTTSNSCVHVKRYRSKGQLDVDGASPRAIVPLWVPELGINLYKEKANRPCKGASVSHYVDARFAAFC